MGCSSSDSEPRGPIPARKTLLATGAILLGAWLVLVTVLTSPASRALGRTISEWVARAETGEVLDAAVTIESVEKLPETLVGRAAELAWRSPDRLRLSAEIEGEPVIATRVGDEVWIHLPGKRFAVVGDNETPRFTGDPASVEPVALPEFRLPLSAAKLRWLPLLLRVETGADEKLRILPSRLGKWLAGLPDFGAVFEPLEKGGARVSVFAPDGKSARLRFDRFAFSKAGEGDDDFALEAGAGETVERVALSHLKRCAEVLAAQLGAKTPALPPGNGKREIVAAAGGGRLELRDGVRVLFLSGTPEEMGRQQGELLRDEVRSVVDRMLYGIGVGSSFSKGRWFFGEIEEAQKRIEPFVSESHLREMDALADAAGLHRQEARLANFFPELFHCSGFALLGGATGDGRLYHGRILDYIRGAGLEDNAVVIVNRPDEGNAWVNVSYAGFTGSVTAMNEKHLAIGEMGGRGEGNWDGKPMAQLVREVMERCETLEEAVELMRRGPRTCEYYYVISD
ncbi:MAG: hypothetical protein KDM91_16145, partial [Verrucomicrobiae bacterium]|nr:hypothetical protein [Verrucomicrobiae bacterium]